MKRYRLSVRTLEARKRRLEPWFHKNEIAVLMEMPLYRLKAYNILQGRRNEVKHVMHDRGLTQREAVRWLYENEYKGHKLADYSLELAKEMIYERD